jgi:site-specific DNA-methyltransferase (adenine-specific)
MDGVKADMVFCDAPYGYKYESNYQDKYEMLQNDDKILDFIPAIWGAMKDNCPVYEFCGWQSLKQWLEYFENTSLDLKNVIIWKKNNWSMGDLKGAYAGQYEVILYLNKGRVELNGARDTDIWEFDREPPKMHPTMKPIELIAYALNKSSKKGDVVLDCFGGSGSTLIACEQTGRKCYTCEIDPKYADVIIARYENLTGNKAVLLT